MRATATIIVKSRRYADDCLCLTAAAAEIAADLGLDAWEVEAEWVGGDEGDRAEIAVTVPDETAGKRAVRVWRTEATYVSTYPTDDGEGAADVEVQVGAPTSWGPWYLRTRDDAGGGDDADDTGYPTEAAARDAASALATERDEATGERADAYIARTRDQAIESGTDPEGGIEIVSKDGSPWRDAPRFSDRAAADKWVARWYDDVARANPGTAILWHLMDCPMVRESEETDAEVGCES